MAREGAVNPGSGRFCGFLSLILPAMFFFPGSNHNKPLDAAKRAQLARKLDKKVLRIVIHVL